MTFLHDGIRRDPIAFLRNDKVAPRYIPARNAHLSRAAQNQAS
ncbi:hypothetical protein [Asticcacaulis sp. W401b]